MLTVSKGRSNATITAYSNDLLQFIQCCPDVEHVTAGDLDRYFAGLRREGLAPATVARAMSAVRGLFLFLVDERIINRDPTTLLPSVRRDRALPKALSETYIAGLLDSITGDDALSIRDRTLIEFLYGTGCRVSEMLGVTVGDIDFDENVIRVTGKGEKQRLVPMGSCLRKALTLHLASISSQRGARRSHAVFLNFRGAPLSRHGVNEILRRRAVQAGLTTSGLHAHSFRHSCASHMIAHGADIRVVQELLGHSSIATTQRYTSVALATLKDAYVASHPRAI
jgi:integrase/recombinase XerD